MTSETTTETTTATTTRAADTAAIHKVLADQYLAWSAGDADAFVADYAPDAIVIMPGQYRRNRDEIRRGMANSFATVLAATTVMDEIRDVRFLGDDIAIVVSAAGILFPGESEVPENRLVYATWVFRKTPSGWQVEAYHNSPIAG